MGAFDAASREGEARERRARARASLLPAVADALTDAMAENADRRARLAEADEWIDRLTPAESRE